MSEPTRKKQQYAPTEERHCLFGLVKKHVLYVISQAKMKKDDRGIDRNITCGFWGHFFKNDASSATAAMARQCGDFPELPEEFQTDEAFLMKHINKQPEFWLSLPDHLKNDIRFAMAIDYSNHVRTSTFQAIAQRFPSNRELWKKYIINGVYLDTEILRSKAGITIRSDRELMLQACSCKPYNLQAVHESLKVDKNFLDQLLETAPHALQYVTHEAQRQFPELVKNNFRPLFRDAKSRYVSSWIFDKIAPEFWNDRQLVVAWFKEGGPFLECMPKAWRDDREIFLLLAEHNITEYREEYLFLHASKRLLKDKAFARTVIELRPCLFVSFDVSVLGDLDIRPLFQGDNSRPSSWIADNITPEFWNDRQLVVSWFKQGGPFLASMPKAWRNDQELFLLLAKHNVTENKDREERLFLHASKRLLKDQDFARTALEYRPCLFFHFHYSILGDADIALLGCAAFTNFCARCERIERISWKFPRNLVAVTSERVKTLTSAHESLQTLLMGMSDDSSILSRLDLGHETSLSFKKMIAEYLEVPAGRKLRHVRTAAHHLGLE